MSANTSFRNCRPSRRRHEARHPHHREVRPIPPPPGPPPIGPPPGGPPLKEPLSPPGAAPPEASPNPQVLLNRIFKLNESGPFPKLRGMIVSPGSGLRLKVPYAVVTISRPVAPAAANDGRSLNTESPLLSRPVVMLKGRPSSTSGTGSMKSPTLPAHFRPSGTGAGRQNWIGHTQWISHTYWRGRCRIRRCRHSAWPNA